jgi:riboflavin transporter FmnP
MSVQRTSVSRTTSLTGAAVFGALAAVITFLIRIPWPVPGFTFLQLDLAEIVDVLAFLLFGPAVGLFTTLIHYLVLNFLPTPSPIFGPLLKLFGVTSMLLGMWLGYGAYARILKRRGGVITGFGIMSGTGAALRAIILTPINYVFLIFVFFPNTVFSTSYLSFYFVGLATYNVIQTVLATVVPFVVVKSLSRAAPNLEVRTWFARMKPSTAAQTQKTL